MAPRRVNFKSTSRGKGALDFEFSKQPIRAHGNTWRLLVIGPSNSGKTTLLVNSIPYFPRPIESISYLAPSSSQNDEAPQKLGIICNKVGINWNPENIEEKTWLAKPDMPKPELVIFDDLYKNKKIEPYVDQIFIRGRHNGQHGAYLTQTPAFVPSSVRNNYNYLLLHKSNFNTDTEQKFAFPKNYLTSISLNQETPSDFLTICKNDLSYQWYDPPKYSGTGNVFKTFKAITKGKKNKIFIPLDKKEDYQIKKGIEMAGNKQSDPIINKEPIYKINNIPKTHITQLLTNNNYPSQRPYF